MNLSLPVTTLTAAAFADAEGAARWLAAQPQANAAAMLAALVEQLEALNAVAVPPRQRFAALEALRASVVAVAAEIRRRYEFRPLPLSSAEQAACVAVARLWRACAQGYVHCLRAELTIPALAGEAAQRALSCLRLEQVSCYVGGRELAADCWPLLHSVWASAEQLGCTRQVVVDRALGETAESTPSGHYAMALLLHLARPYALTRSEFAAASRWFMRWRELAEVGAPPPEGIRPGATSIQPINDPSCAAGAARWLSLRGVLRKMRQRLELLAAGQSPASLKLGGGLAARECAALLKTLDYRLTHPQAPNATPATGRALPVFVGIAECHRALGGALSDGPAQSAAEAAASAAFASRLAADQLAVFGHVVRAPQRSAESRSESWRLLEQNGSQLRLLRAADAHASRLALRGLLLLRLPDSGETPLATIVSLCVGRDGNLRIEARRLNGQPLALLAEARAPRGVQATRQAAILVAAGGAIGAPQLFLAAGLAPRATPITFLDLAGEPVAGLRLEQCLDQGEDCERWSVAV